MTNLEIFAITCVSYIVGVLTIPGIIAGYALWDYFSTKRESEGGSYVKGKWN